MSLQLHGVCLKPSIPGTSAAPPAPSKRAGKSCCVPALIHAPKPQTPQALLNPALAGLKGQREGFCRAAISISDQSVPFLLGTRCFLKDMGLPCTNCPKSLLCVLEAALPHQQPQEALGFPVSP